MKNVLVIGSGSIAQKHITNLIELNYKVEVFSESRNRVNHIKNSKKIHYLKNLDNLEKFEFVILANATYKHLKYLKLITDRKKHIYCEKPIFFRKFNYSKIRKNLIKNNVLFFSGYQLLRHEKISYLKKILKNEKIISFLFEVGYDFKKWRKKQSFSKNYFLEKKKGGGVIFELIHEINLIQNLIGKIEYIKTIKKNIKTNQIEDLAISMIKTNNGIVGSLYQDMISQKYFRSYKIITTKKIIILDIANSKMIINNKIDKIDNKKNSQKELLKKNIKLFSKLIKKKNTLKFFDESIIDLKIALKMVK